MKFRIQVFGYECVLKCLSISDKEVGLVKKINDPWKIEQQFFDCSEIIYETSSLFFDENIYFKILDKDGVLLDSFNSYKIDAIGDVVGDDNFGYEDVVVDPKWTDKFNNTLLLIHEYKGSNMEFIIESNSIPTKDNISTSSLCIGTPNGDYDLLNTIGYNGKLLQCENFWGGVGKCSYVKIFTNDEKTIEIE